MLIYIYLIIYILIIALITKALIKKPESEKIVCLILSMIGIYLVLALKAPSVGRDIEGYKRMYESFKGASWSNFDLYWTEPGYEFLEMFFNHILKFDFQGFAACVYAFSIISYTIFFYRYSQDVTLSCLIYICFSFFTFDISGIRNMLSISIVLLAVHFADKKSFKWNILYFILVLVAAQIHRSAYFYILMFFFIRFDMRKNKRLLLPLFAIVALVLRPVAHTLLLFFDTKNAIEQISIGGNVIVYILALAFPFVVWFVAKYENDLKQKYIGKNTPRIQSEEFFSGMEMPLRVFYFGVVTTVLAGTGTLVRLAQAPLFFMTLVLPAPIQKLETKSRFLMKTIMLCFFAAYFYFLKVRPNELDFVPYVFFWNA